MKKFLNITSIFCLFILMFSAFTAGAADKPIKLVGATQLPDDYVFYRTMMHFAEKVQEYYDGPLEIDVHHSGDLGTEKDFFEFMSQGVSVDFAIVAPSWMSTWDKRASFLDPPFLWRDLDHWGKALNSGEVFEPIAEGLRKKGVRIIGYGGGGTRNTILNKEIHTMEDPPNVLLRVMGAPIQAKVFNAVGFQATPLNYLEVYNAIKTGVIDGLENESASLKSMKFYEVAPNIILTRHTITVRPLCFSESRFQSFPKELQDAILKAGEEAAAWHRATEVKEDAEALKQMADEGTIKLIEFPDADKMRDLAVPVLAEYAKELGAEDIYNAIQAIQ
ncbi:MAG: TRAP transporter substrate-binding protein [bacterium]|nr:TRAP transporter substrate-binding protein [bacterium]